MSSWRHGNDGNVSFAMSCLAIKGYAAMFEHKDPHTAHACTETHTHTHTHNYTHIVTETLKVRFSPGFNIRLETCMFICCCIASVVSDSSDSPTYSGNCDRQ